MIESKSQINKLRRLAIDKSWTLFLDRDGVINQRIESDYVKTWDQFKLLPNIVKALKKLRSIFGRIIIVTNQRGIGKGLMTIQDLESIHVKLTTLLSNYGIKLDAIYFCPDVDEKSLCRKPNIGMALIAKRDFPDIIFKKSIMIGDSISDMKFGKKLEMVTVFIGPPTQYNFADFIYNSLWAFAVDLLKARKKDN